MNARRRSPPRTGIEIEIGRFFCGTVDRPILLPVVFCHRGLFVAAAQLAGRLFLKGRLHAWYRVYEEPCGCAQGRAWPNNSALDHLKLFWRHNHTGYFKG